ncbi:MAG: arginine deiminase family protein [Thermoplasmata archaeon]|nr:arginine deiminase family protein [Thermoplasmata archaeon]
MMARRALVREPGSGFSRCISTHPMRHTVDVERAREQHAAYVRTLEDLGLEVMRLGRDDSLPDSCFVEDTAVVHGTKALICRPAKDARRGETEAIMGVLAEHLAVKAAERPATVEGGDVLHLEGRLVCGLTKRTNGDGARQLAEWLDVRVDSVDDRSIMHLKSYVSHIDEGRVLVTRGFARQPALEGLEKLIVPDGEEYAANVLSVNGAVVMPEGYPATKALLERSGAEVVALEMTEFPKCDGAMTCLSILF